jgi:RsiW-degrading membrane proteinase PrsW (M82 family)
VVLSIILLYASLLLCGFVLGIVVWKYDLYLREPWWLLLIATALGAASIHLAGRVQVWMIHEVTSRGTLVSDPAFALMAGATEEIGKLLVVLIIWVAARAHFNEPIDGLIYGSFAGLGAALEESVAVMVGDGTRGMLPAQEPVRLAGHLVMGGIAGFGAGLAATRQRRGLPAFAGSLITAITLHTLWDIAAFSAANFHQAHHRLRPIDNAAPMALMLSGMIVYRAMVTAGVRLTFKYLKR